MIAVEFAKQLRRPRTYLTFAALGVFALALTLALQATGASRAEHVGDIPLVIVPSTSGFAVPLLALSSTMKFFLPLAVAVFAGEAVAGEAGWGSLRYALGRGVGRTRFLFAKAAVAGAFSVAAVALVPAAALLVGSLAFGWHPIVAIDGGAATQVHRAAATFSPVLALERLGVATAYVAVGMASIFAFAFLLSTLTTKPFVAVAGGVGLTVISRVLNADYLPGVAAVYAYMPNNDVDLWQRFFQSPAQTKGMLHFVVLQLAYFAVLFGAAWWWFTRKDVLT